jgi:hypothetical protein
LLIIIAVSARWAPTQPRKRASHSITSSIGQRKAARSQSIPLKLDGIVVMYNWYHQACIVERIAAMAKQIFGCGPIVLSLP